MNEYIKNIKFKENSSNIIIEYVTTDNRHRYLNINNDANEYNNIDREFYNFINNK